MKWVEIVVVHNNSSSVSRQRALWLGDHRITILGGPLR